MWIVFESRDGSSTLLSEKFGVTYHSKYGAIQESKHVFIREGLYYKCIGKKELNILEMGFGTGLNTFLTSIESERLGLTVKYTSVENNPVDLETLAKLNYCEKVGLTNGNCLFNRIHELAWNEWTNLTDKFSLFKKLHSFEEVTFTEPFHLIYFDAFAPNVQPQLWEVPLLQKMYDALLPKGVLVTYCAKGDFKRALKSVGFKVESPKGPPGKREMVRATKPR
ncbi:MAG: tRNA (5-methylaminomethyl-2-thiouridine)(34)-methyltransferase MnmD [Bacteroidota bacterium]